MEPITTNAMYPSIANLSSSLRIGQVGQQGGLSMLKGQHGQVVGSSMHGQPTVTKKRGTQKNRRRIHHLP